MTTPQSPLCDEGPAQPSATQFPRAMAGILEFPCTATRLPDGHTLVVDAGDETGAGSEVIELDGRGQIVWQYGGGLRFAHSAVRTRDGNTLIADTTNDRLIEVSPDKRIVWTTEHLGDGDGRLSDGSRLHYPNNALELDDGTLLVTDRNNDRCLIIDHHGQVLWQYAEGIKHPHNAEQLGSGNILIADSDGNRIVEVTPDKRIAWTYGDGSPEMLSWPRHARRLDDGNTLITDSKNARVIEVTPGGDIVWQYRVDYLAKFYSAEKLANGNVLIADQQGHQVLEIDPGGTTAWMFRNYVYPTPIFPRLRNGSFKKRAADGLPEDWSLYTRFSEGGGGLIWGEDARGRPCPGLRYDRNGALCLQQTIAATPGMIYHMAGQIRTEDLRGAACFQLSFIDARGAAVYDAPDIPRGETFDGTTDWTPSTLEAVAPPAATAVEVRLFLTGRGKAWVKGLLVHT
ncbi:MAG: PQQ-binding-like beta-propeller repeat protein [Planctomycetota bacterium]